MPQGPARKPIHPVAARLGRGIRQLPGRLREWPGKADEFKAELQADFEEFSADIKARVADDIRFLRTWVDKPMQMGAVAPSSPALAARMAAFVDPARPGLVVELGPGTGVVTKALLERGLPPERLASIEYSAEFCNLLRGRFPGIHVVHGDAYAIRRALGPLADAPLAAVVSGLPLLTRPPAQRIRLVEEALAMMPPGAPFVQFSYSLVPPVPPGAGDYTVERSSWVVMNLPPARVWVYRRPG